ncbi:PDZ domain-containing protein [Glycomyces algeriensis]|uniref:YlbL family protein n=1 Tax=Glycomyces algeriensis TaxID=256037 RepID=UPI0022D6EE50|nr:S16 family serine protease [Glycomyces algeriensis]MDA1368742.1 PDZ domain-containing protein [Glycomyces algeriensis]MDR7352485.1 PDZ domain-containing protein [Glycomyces algeriensis]
MRRRGITVLLGAVLVAVLTWQALMMDVAYVVFSDGPTEDVLGAGEVDGVEHQIITADTEYPSEGQLRLTTVRVKQSVTLVQALRYWTSNEYAIVPRDLVYPPGESEEEIAEEQEADWAESQSNAEQAALGYLGEPAVIEVVADSGGLLAGDVITAVDGTAVTSLQGLADYAESETTVTVTRAGASVEVPGVTLGDADLQSTHDDPYGIEIDTEALDIGGPSAGLIFALGIVDRVTEGDLTDGKVVAGTGEIDPEGNVGGIGGIQQKIHGADEAGAEVFLSPASNCSDAVTVAPEDMTIVRVETLADAVSALESLAAGGEVTTC